MAYSAVGSFVNDDVTTGQTSFSVTTVNVGDLILFCCSLLSTSITVTGVSGGGANGTGWQQIQSPVANSPTTNDMWWATVGSTGAQTITVTFSTTIGTTECGRAAWQFTAGLGASTTWTVDTANSFSQTTASTTVTYPTLVPAGSGELYTGVSTPNGFGAAGSTSGYTYKTTSFGEVVLWNLSVTGSQSPTATQSSSASASSHAAIFTATAPVDPPPFRWRAPGRRSPTGRFSPFFTDSVGPVASLLTGDATLAVTAATSTGATLTALAAATVATTASVTTAGAVTTQSGATLATTAAVTTAGLRTALGAASLAATATVTTGATVGTWGPPTGLIATPVSDTQIDLSWIAMVGASGYDIERDGVVIATDVVGTSYSDTGLTSNSTHQYRARSVRA
jgi:hypothetical protein